MRRSTELVCMIAGCAALIATAILLPTLLLTPVSKVEQPAEITASAQAPASSPAPPAVLPRLPIVSQPPDPPLPSSGEATDRAKANEQLAAARPEAPSVGTAPAEAGRAPDQVAVPSPSEAKNDAVTPNEQPPGTDAMTGSNAGRPSEQIAMPLPGGPSDAAVANAPVAGESPSEPGAPREVGPPADAVASIGANEPKDAAKANDAVKAEEAAAALPRVRAPWWCSDPRGDDAAAVCRSRELLALDAELNALYSRLMAREQNSELRNAQRRWLVQRQSCGADVACLKRHYEKRIGALARQ